MSQAVADCLPGDVPHLRDLGEGQITDAEYDAITEEMKETHRMMINKYDRK